MSKYAPYPKMEFCFGRLALPESRERFESGREATIHQQKISYFIADGRRVTCSFEDLEGKTKASTTFDAENQNPAEMQRRQAILDNFKKYTERSDVND